MEQRNAHPIQLTIPLCLTQIERERDELYNNFVAAIQQVQQKCSLKNLLLEKKLTALTDAIETKEAQLTEVLAATNLDPEVITSVTKKLEVSASVEWLNTQLFTTDT